MFWSSVELTGNQTAQQGESRLAWFWSSVELTGNQTDFVVTVADKLFWSSVELTGNQTRYAHPKKLFRFGAVSN